MGLDTARNWLSTGGANDSPPLAPAGPIPVTTVAVSTSKKPSLYRQACDAFATIDRHLAEAGTSKSSILMVMCYITNIADKSELNRAWDEWVDRAHLPLRACLGVDLEGDDLVELVVTAAL